MLNASATGCPSMPLTHLNDPELLKYEAAILCAFQFAERDPRDQSSNIAKQQAEAYCHQKKSDSENSWCYALNLFRCSDHQYVKFYSLQVLQEILMKGVDDNTAFVIRSSLFEWIKQQSQYIEEESAFLKTKIAVVWALMIKRDYPDQWPTAFSEWIALLSFGRSFVELYLRILLAIHDEVVDSTLSKNNLESASNMRVKDAMRESSCITETFQLFYKILASCGTSESDTSLCAVALEAMKYHISWVDINLIVNDQFIPLLFQMAREDTNLRCLVINCIYEIIDKGMSHEKKLALLKQLDILQFLRSLDIHNDENFAEEVAEVVNSIGLELLHCIKEFAAFPESEQYVVSNTMLCEIIPLVWELFSNENKAVSEEVFDFVNAVGTLIQCNETNVAHAQGLSFEPSRYIPQILYGIYRQTRQSEDSVMDVAEFEEYRRSLYRIYINIIRKRPADVLGFLSELTEQLPMQFEQVEASELESFFFMIYRFREGVVVAKDVQALEDRNSVFTAILKRVHTGMLSPSSNGFVFSPSVLMTYYDFTVRYSRCLQYHAEFIPLLLSMIFGSSGLSNSHGHIRSRVCYQCVRLVKSLGDCITPHIPTILQALQPRLIIVTAEESQVLSKSDPLYLTYEDQLNLFEVTGHVIAAMVWTREGRVDENIIRMRLQYSKTVLDPLLMHTKEAALAAKHDNMPKNSESDDSYVPRLLCSMAHFLKAFKVSNCLSQEKELAAQVLLASTEVLQVPSMALQYSVRSKIVCVLHRVVLIMDPRDFLAYGVESIDRLMACCDGQDVIETIQLVNQLIFNFKADLKPFMQQKAITFMHHVCTLMPKDSGQSISHVKDNEQLEREMMQKYLFLYMLHLVMHGLDEILYNAGNQSQLEAIFTLVLDGCVGKTDTAIKRTCFTIVHQVGLRWLVATGAPAEIRLWCSQYLIKKATVCVFQLGQDPEFNLEDAQSQSVIKEMATMLQDFIQELGQEYVALVQYLMSERMPMLETVPVCEKLCSNDVANVELLRKVFQRLRKGFAVGVDA